MEKCIWSLGKAQHCTTVPPTAAGMLLQDAISKLALDKWSCRELVGLLRQVTQIRASQLTSVVLGWSYLYHFLLLVFCFMLYQLSLCVFCSSCGNCVVSLLHLEMPLVFPSALLCYTPGLTPVGPPLVQFSCVTDVA